MNLSRRHPAPFLLAGAAFAAALVHAAAMGNYLVSDSWVFVHPRSLAETFRFFWTSIIPPEGEAFWLRPVPMFLFWFENLLHPGTSWLPHLTNILLHVANVLLLWDVTSTMIARGRDDGRMPDAAVPAFAACLVYGLHPLAVGSVDWVAARFDVACVTFGLAGMRYWLRWDAGTAGMKSFAAAVLLLVCSLFSKEQGIVFFASCAFLSLLGLAGKRRRGAWMGVAVPIAAAAAYTVYRLIVFGGIGGYVTSRNGLSILPPLNYLAAVLFPYPNVFPGWRFTWMFWAASAILAASAFAAWSLPRKAPSAPAPRYFLAALALLGLGLLTTAPNPGLDFARVVGHAESRFALIPVTAAAMLAGLAASWIRTQNVQRAFIAAMLVWSVVSAWRTTVQVQAWESAGFAARSIVGQTLRLVPDPPPGSTIILLDIPRNTPQYVYIFGIGLDYALHAAYGREGINVVRYPTKADFHRADPDRDAVLQFHASNGQLERLRPVRTKRSEVIPPPLQ